MYKSLVVFIFEVFQRLMFERNTKREKRLRMLYLGIITQEETDELYSVLPNSGRFWIRFQRCCLCTSVRACNSAKARITGNVVSNDILQIKTETRKLEGIGLCDKYRDVDLLAEIEAVQDGFGLKKSSIQF